MIEEQLALERDMVEHGIARYRRAQSAAVEGGRGSETSYAKRLIPELCLDLAEAIEAAKTSSGPGRRAKYLALIQDVESTSAAFITLKMIFDTLIKGDTLGNLAVSLGQRIEDEIRFSKFRDEHEAYYKAVIKDFKRKNTVNYRHRHRVLVHKQNELGSTWQSWSNQERMLLGVKLIELCMQSTGIIRKVISLEGNVRVKGKLQKKKVARIEATEEAMHWIHEHMEQAAMLHPDNGPCVVPPNDWEGLYDGGYFTPEVRRRVPFVKIKSKAHRQAIKDNDFSKPMAAVNTLQRTPWTVNTKVHEVIKEVWRKNLRIGMPPSEPFVIPPCPLPEGLAKEDMTPEQEDVFLNWKREAAKLYTDERERVSKCIQLSRVMSMATKYSEYKEFYYVYNCDFRGRVYVASPGLSPQGPDFAKGLLQFSRSKPLGEDGALWLKVHGANTYGYDKDSYAGRAAWVAENESGILAVAENPLGSAERSFWSAADKPYQFLAFCFEYAGYRREGIDYRSSIPIALDGSCNGLQNFSAMLRDGIGGAATNLLKSEKPQDIYGRVADVVVRRLRDRRDDPLAAEWLAFGVTRKITKKPVMTLPYGSTRQSCRESVEDHIRDANNAGVNPSPWEAREIFDASLYLSEVIWDSIGEVVIAARAAMDWLQRASRAVSRANTPLLWHTPLGFRIYQGSMKTEAVQVNTQLCGRTVLSISSDTDRIDSRKQAQGASPNFIHGCDATHLMLTTLDGDEQGITDWAMIHDDYGTHACDIPLLHKVIRESFFSIYNDNDILQDFKDEIESNAGVELDDIPAKGNLDLEDVLEAEYFFG